MASASARTSLDVLSSASRFSRAAVSSASRLFSSANRLFRPDTSSSLAARSRWLSWRSCSSCLALCCCVSSRTALTDSCDATRSLSSSIRSSSTRFCSSSSLSSNSLRTASSAFSKASSRSSICFRSFSASAMASSSARLSSLISSVSCSMWPSLPLMMVFRSAISRVFDSSAALASDKTSSSASRRLTVSTSASISSRSVLLSLSDASNSECFADRLSSSWAIAPSWLVDTSCKAARRFPSSSLS
mmetsp:Transcript_7136/g.27328  ORF Transcript_7136/g.27328 Transcript_7136/m.27328 type:complete len:246 (-) Transcript_7136:323-1060(-)